MKITYLGHACFKVEGKDVSVVFDPYAEGSVPGLSKIDVESDVVLCSHEHADHNAKELVKLSGKEVALDIETVVVPHDDADGSLRGMNNISIVYMDGKKVIHYGDIGRDLLDDEVSKLSDADVIMIPCGGHYTIDALQAKKIIEETNPKLTILMHYHKGNVGYDVLSDIETIKDNIPNIQEVEFDTIDADDYQGVITMEVKQ